MVAGSGTRNSRNASRRSGPPREGPSAEEPAGSAQPKRQRAAVEFGIIKPCRHHSRNGSQRDQRQPGPTRSEFGPGKACPTPPEKPDGQRHDEIAVRIVGTRIPNVDQLDKRGPIRPQQYDHQDDRNSNPGRRDTLRDRSSRLGRIGFPGCRGERLQCNHDRSRPIQKNGRRDSRVIEKSCLVHGAARQLFV